jgi:hypothetical protein
MGMTGLHGVLEPFQLDGFCGELYSFARVCDVRDWVQGLE